MRKGFGKLSAPIGAFSHFAKKVDKFRSVESKQLPPSAGRFFTAGSLAGIERFQDYQIIGL